MSDSKLVRASRDGDQFHYLWAARRCLQLLSPTSGVVAITIEGASPSELPPSAQIDVGEELIDVAEYSGSEDVAQATLIRYVQLKHSTLHAADEWTPSRLEKTLRGFADRYRAFQTSLPADALAGKLELWFVTNRPVSPSFLATVEDIVRDQPPRHPDNVAKLERFTSFSGPALSAFCKLLRFAGNQAGYWDQRNILHQEVGGYLPESDVDGPTQLKELVTRKATSEGAGNPTITKIDVLRALKTDENRLFPAPCRIEQLSNAVPREHEAELISEIVNAHGVPVVVHAAAGIGKSVFATRIKLALPEGSCSVIYDCFGGGQYRSASGYRHRHRDALVQIANELAAEGLCHPLIPTPHADPSAYVTAFLHRLTQAAASLRSAHPGALLCIVIDAADNAQMAAEEIGEHRSFVRDLVREQLPDSVRLVALCRTHRQEKLDLPPHARPLELTEFSRAETAAHVRQFFFEATEQDVEEFHRLSSHNPRVQSLALSRNGSLSEILRSLGPNPTTVEQAIGNLLNESIAKLRDAVGAVEKRQIDRICAGLAVLRPLIPISVLASMSGVDAAAIKSLAFDLGRPLLVTGDTIQFFDEPSETWFREKFKPATTDLAAFVASLRPLVSGSAYVASALPQLLLEARHFKELVALALSSEDLPETSPLERRDVELQRLQFALKASLRTRHYKDAAKLALKAGGETAGDTRQRKLIQANTDLAAAFMNGDRIQEMVSRRTFGSGWVGSHHAYESGLMSGRPELLGDARSRLRMASEWLINWSKVATRRSQA